MLNYRNLKAGPRINKLVDKRITKYSQNGTAPDFSGSMDLAWALVQRMSRDGFSLKLFAAPESKGKISAIVSFICPIGPCKKHGNKLHDHHGAYDVTATSVPLAICRAALEAWPKKTT